MCRRQAALAVLTWTILGVKLATKKGQFGRTVSWIGATFSATNDGIEATILSSRLLELKELALEIRSSNIVSVKALRTFTGKCQSMASLLYTWRPFVHMFYAAIQTCETGTAPAGCRWVKQIIHPLEWIIAFLSGVRAILSDASR